MPPAAKRNIGVVLFDLDSSNRESLLKLLLKFAVYRFYPCQVLPKDAYELILVNSKETTSEKYPNVAKTDIKFNEILCSAELLESLESIESAEAESGDWLDGLLFALKRIKAIVDLKGVITKQIIFLTSLDKSSVCDQVKVQTIIRQLTELDVYLYIIGPEVEFPSPILDTSNIPEVIIDSSNTTLIAAKKIVQETEHSVMCNAKLGLDLLWCFKHPKGLQPWRVELSFGSLLKIPSMTIGVYKKDKPVKLSSWSKPKTYYCLAEDESVKIEDEDIVSGIILHDRFIRIEDNLMFKEDTVRGNDILGFTDKKNVPEIYLRGDTTYYLMPNPDQGESNSFYLLVDVLHEQGKYGIMRRVYNKNNRPKTYVLIPCIHKTPKCFIMSLLPNADDVVARLSYDTETKNINVSCDTNFKNFFDSLDITKEDCNVKIPLSPNIMMLPYLNKLTDVAMNKATSRKYNFEDIEYDLWDQPKNPLAEAVQEAWPVD